MMSKIEYTCTTDTGEFGGQIALSDTSPWCVLLGDWGLPAAGAIDAIHARLGDQPVRDVELRGDAGACLLPLLWFRSIWMTDPEARITLRWDDPGDLPEDPRRQCAARLACLMADAVLCPDRHRVLDAWGFDPEAPGIAEEVFDLLSALMDLWDPDLRLAAMGDDWSESMRRALQSCRLQGYERVGIYGAGTHTRAVGEALMQPGVEIRCIIDDDQRRHGERLWGFPIVSLQDAADMDLDAVVLSANSIEHLLWERSAVLRERGIPVLRLYTHENEQQEASPAIGHASGGVTA